MSDIEPRAKIILEDGRELEVTRRNSGLYTFIGQVSLRGIEMEAERFSHIFIANEINEEERVMSGMYIYKEQDVYPQLSEFMIENRYPLFLNQIRVDPNERKAYTDYLDAVANSELGDSGDFVPEGWL